MNLINQPTRLSKTELSSLAQSLLEPYRDGDESPLQSFTKLHFAGKAIEAAKQELASDAITAVEMDGKETSFSGAKVAVRYGRETYFYGDDPEWNDLNNRIQDLKDAIKHREAFLRTLEKPLVDPQTGEMSYPARVTGFTKTSIAITYPRE